MAFLNQHINVKIKRLRTDKDVFIPYYATEGAAGVDLCACIDEEIILPPGQVAKVPTGLAIELPNINVVAFICARSGLATKFGITLANGVGVIDSDYRGEIQVPMINHSTEVFVIKNGERIAQMLFMPVFKAELVEVESLHDTVRGEGGFGSTGI